VCLYSDSLSNTCGFVDNGPRVLKVYVIHKYAVAAGAVEFSAPMPACMAGASWLGDITPMAVTIGNSQTGVTIGYPGCKSGSLHVLTILYMVTGGTLPDCAYPVLPHPAVGKIQIAECSRPTPFTHTISGGTSYINSNLPCECVEVLTDPVLQVTPSSLTFLADDSVRTLQVSNIGVGTLTWAASTNRSWMSVDTGTGTGDAAVHVTVDRTGLASGTYDGVVVVTSNGGQQRPPVTMIVDYHEPVLKLSPAILDLGTSLSKHFSITNIGAPGLTWNIIEAIPWLSVAPVSGSGDRDVTVTVDHAGLPVGPQSGVIDVHSNGGDGTVEVRMQVPPPTLNFSPKSLSFGTVATSLPLSIANAGTGDLQWTITSNKPWLSVIPDTGTNNTQVTVSVDRTGLSTGSYTASLSITSNGGNGNVSVTMTVETPELAFSPLSFVFGPGVDSLALTIDNVGALPLTWNIASDQPWLSARPCSGADHGVVWVRVDRTGLPDSTYFGNLFISSNGGSGTVPVILGSTATAILGVTPTFLSLSGAIVAGTFDIANHGGGTLAWTITKDEDWINVTPPVTGLGNQTVTVTVDPALAPSSGAHEGHVEVTSNGGNATVTVRFQKHMSYAVDRVGLYADVYGWNCAIQDLASPGILTIHVVHTAPHEAGCDFAAPKPACMIGATYVEDVSPFSAVIGNSQTGVSVAYGTCHTGPVLVMSIRYLTQGTIKDCCYYPVIADPNSLWPGHITVTDCTPGIPLVLSATGSSLVVNENATCSCANVTVHETTWGRVKALYSTGDVPEPRRE
jgi:hypothetical protein